MIIAHYLASEGKNEREAGREMVLAIWWVVYLHMNTVLEEHRRKLLLLPVMVYKGPNKWSNTWGLKFEEEFYKWNEK